MTTRALVLSGGGPVGIAWESGLIGGLAEAGIDLSEADFILGTSAGSFVGARLAMGTTPAELAAPFLAMPLLSGDEAKAPPLPSGDAPKTAQANPPNAMPMVTLLEQARASGKSQNEILADIGAYALAAETISEEAFIESFGKRMSQLPADYWPDRGFACTAVDAVDGGFHLWTKDSRVGLARAVASSCSVPGIYPPVTLKGRRYIDGGMRSGSNADQVVGYDRVMVIAIRAGAEGPLAERAKAALDAEIKALTDAGAKVEVLYPDAASITAFGVNLMDARQRPAAAKAGYAAGAGGIGAGQAILDSGLDSGGLTMGDMVIVAYRPKPGKEADLLTLTRDHVPALRRLGFATDRPTLAMRGKDGTIVEVFEWAEGAIAKAHEHPEVHAMWAKYGEACDYIPLKDLPEAANMFAEFKPIDL